MSVQLNPVLNQPRTLTANSKDKGLPLARAVALFGSANFKYDAFHAHVYYDLADKAKAEKLRDDFQKAFGMAPGRLVDQPSAGSPHPKPMFFIGFREKDFAAITQWLMKHRNGLTVMVHPHNDPKPNVTEDEARKEAIAAHTTEPLWMLNPGQPPLKLNLRAFGK